MRRASLGVFGVAIATAAIVVLVTAVAPHAPTLDTVGTSAPWRSHFRLATSATDPIVPNADNYASRTTPSSPLLLFLAATRHRPSDYREFLRVARAGGYHVLALDYWNRGLSVQKTCGTDARCYGAVQRNRLDGSRPGMFSAVNPANSIVTRLTSALARLQTKDPGGEWSRFVDASGIRWNRIVVAGHSQGGGEAAYIAHIHRVRGALMFSSPVDSDHDIHAAWMAHPGATPASRLYGLVDTGDMFYRRVLASWQAMGMNALPSHEIVTHRRLGGPDASHLRDITDESPVAPDGTPVFAATWARMLAQLYSPPSVTHP
ncbi:MAG TPA: hypothetical protein VGM94_16195 [Galbitalea sp.]